MFYTTATCLDGKFLVVDRLEVVKEIDVDVNLRRKCLPQGCKYKNLLL